MARERCVTEAWWFRILWVCWSIKVNRQPLCTSWSGTLCLVLTSYTKHQPFFMTSQRYIFIWITFIHRCSICYSLFLIFWPCFVIISYCKNKLQISKWKMYLYRLSFVQKLAKDINCHIKASFLKNLEWYNPMKTNCFLLRLFFMRVQAKLL